MKIRFKTSNDVIKKMRRRNTSGLGENKTHFKLFKAGKSWLMMGVSLITFGITAWFSNGNAYASTDQDSTDISEESVAGESTVNEPVHVLKSSTAQSKLTSAEPSSASVSEEKNAVLEKNVNSSSNAPAEKVAAAPSDSSANASTSQSAVAKSAAEAKNSALSVEPEATGTYTVTYTYKDGNGVELAPAQTKTVRWTNIADAVIDPVHVAGYQIDTAKSIFAFFNLVPGIAFPISFWLSTMPGQTFTSFNDFFTKLMTRHSEGYDDTTQSDKGIFDFVYTKSNAKINAKDVTITVGDSLPTAADFSPQVLDDNGNALDSSKVVISDSDTLDNLTVGDYQVNLEYFDQTSLLSIFTTATLHVVGKTTSSQATVNTQSAVYGDNYSFSLTSNGTDLVVPDGLTSDDFTIIGPEYSQSGALAVGDYEVQLNDTGKQKIVAANPNLKLIDDNYVSGKITITPKKSDYYSSGWHVGLR